METKDWILLGVPILANGIIVFIFQKFITIKLERLTKKSNIRDEIIILFGKITVLKRSYDTRQHSYSK